MIYLYGAIFTFSLSLLFVFSMYAYYVYCELKEKGEIDNE